MDAPFLEGPLVRLSPLTAESTDLARYASWLNDAATTVYMGSGRFPATPGTVAEYIRAFEGSDAGVLLGVFERSTGKHVGNVTLHMIDWKDRRGEIGILIGDSDARGKGYAREAVDLLVGHAFDRLGLHKVTAGYVDGNEASAALFASCGFRVEGTLREHFYLDGRFRDYVKVGLLASERAAGRT